MTVCGGGGENRRMCFILLYFITSYMIIILYWCARHYIIIIREDDATLTNRGPRPSYLSTALYRVLRVYIIRPTDMYILLNTCATTTANDDEVYSYFFSLLYIYFFPTRVCVKRVPSLGHRHRGESVEYICFRRTHTHTSDNTVLTGDGRARNKQSCRRRRDPRRQNRVCGAAAAKWDFEVCFYTMRERRRPASKSRCPPKVVGGGGGGGSKYYIILLEKLQFVSVQSLRYRSFF